MSVSVPMLGMASPSRRSSCHAPYNSLCLTSARRRVLRVSDADQPETYAVGEVSHRCHLSRAHIARVFAVRLQ